MGRVIIRPTVPADLSHVIGEPLPCRIRALTLEADGGRVLGVGGIAFPPHGLPIAFVQQLPDAKKYPVAFHRAGLLAMRTIRDSGLRGVLATAEPSNAAALRWLKRLGFVEAPRQNVRDKVLFVFRPT